MAYALIAAELALLAVLIWRRPLRIFPVWLAATTIRGALFTPDRWHVAVYADWVTLPLMTGAVLECAWLSIRDLPERRHVALGSLSLAAMGAAATWGVRLHSNILPGQYIRAYLFPSLCVGLLGVVMWTGLNHRLDVYAALWCVHLAALAVSNVVRYGTRDEWLAIFEVQRAEWLAVLLLWLVRFTWPEPGQFRR